MKKRVLFCMLVGVIASAGLASFWLIRGHAVEAQNNPPAPHPLAAINQKARFARSGDLKDAQDYIDEVVRVVAFDGVLRGSPLSVIKDRVGRAESQFRRGQTAAISEGKIVRTVNGLARKFKMPDYVKTCSYEVRKLRIALLQNFPQVISQTGGDVSVGSKLDPQMSPAEALFVLGMMLHQKVANPEFQMTPTERANHWANAHNHGSDSGNMVDPAQDRSREVRDALDRAAADASMSDALHLSDVILNTMGIER